MIIGGFIQVYDSLKNFAEIDEKGRIINDQDRYKFVKDMAAARRIFTSLLSWEVKHDARWADSIKNMKRDYFAISTNKSGRIFSPALNVNLPSICSIEGHADFLEKDYIIHAECYPGYYIVKPNGRHMRLVNDYEIYDENENGFYELSRLSNRLRELLSRRERGGEDYIDALEAFLEQKVEEECKHYRFSLGCDQKRYEKYLERKAKKQNSQLEIEVTPQSDEAE